MRVVLSVINDLSITARSVSSEIAASSQSDLLAISGHPQRTAKKSDRVLKPINGSAVEQIFHRTSDVSSTKAICPLLIALQEMCPHEYKLGHIFLKTSTPSPFGGNIFPSLHQHAIPKSCVHQSYLGACQLFPANPPPLSLMLPSLQHELMLVNLFLGEFQSRPQPH